ncbi:hypothetical protein HMPREF9148_01333 [Prevotella sp. F0091]|nr:hypothetical protein HMPREF9148_01333 [Prevotella sp. F0091]
MMDIIISYNCPSSPNIQHLTPNTYHPIHHHSNHHHPLFNTQHPTPITQFIITQHSTPNT